VVQRPTFARIVTNDYAAFLGLAFPLLAPVLFILFALLDGVPVPTTLVYFVIIPSVVFGLVLLAWRLHLIRAVFESGHEVPATISGVWFYRDRGRIEYIYTFQGQKYRGGNAIMKNKRTLAFQPGDQVLVAVDRKHPKRAFIRDLYQA
jgi:hypothetical protein